MPRTLTTLLFCAGFASLFLGSAEAQSLTVLWERQGIDDSSQYGSRVFALGDQNEDGYADWGVSGPTAHRGNSSGYPDPTPSRVELFYGGNPPSSEPYRVYGTIPDSIYWILGGNSLGDLNGDGKTDFLITFSTTWQSSVTGRDAIYFGGGDPNRPPDIILNRSHHSGGRNLVGIGDFNGDSFDDLLDRSFDFHDDDPVQLVYYGSPTFDTLPDWVISNEPGTQSALPLTWGDLNGDGFSDILPRSGIYEGSVHAFLGSESPDTIPVLMGDVQDYFGYPIVLPDINGDDADDLTGDAFGLVATYLGREQLHSTPDYVLSVASGADLTQRFSIGDFNGDGVNDFVGLTQSDNNAWWGQFSLYLGYSWLNPNPIITIEGRQQPYNLIGPISAAGLGDVNGDGVDDFIVGAWNEDWDGMRGNAMIFAGDPSYHVDANPHSPFIPQEILVRVSPNPFNSSTTLSFNLPSETSLTVTVFDITGREVMNTPLGTLPAGTHSHTLNATHLPSGIYFARISTLPPRFLASTSRSWGDQGGVIKLALIR